MADNEEVLIEVKFDSTLVDEAAKKMVYATEEIKRLKAEQKSLNEEWKAGTITNEQYGKELAENTKQMDANKRALKSNTAVVQASTLAQYDANASLDEQRQYLNTLQKAYASMDKEQMEMVGGQETLQKMIKNVSDSLKEQEHAIGDDRRNVGNYTESILKAAESSHDLADAFKVTSVASTGLGKATDSLDKAMKLASKNPWMAVLSLLLPLLQQLFKALMGNEQAMEQVRIIMDAMKQAFKQFEPIISKVAGLLTNVLGKAFDFITSAITNVLKGVDWLAKKLGFDLNLSSAFENAAVAATDMADAEEVAAERIVQTETKKNDEITKQREEMERRRRTDLENEIADLEAKRDKELAIAGLTAEEKLEIEDYYAQQIEQKRKEAADKEAADAEEAERKRLEAKQKAREQFGIEPGKSPEQQELDLLQQAREQDLLNDEEYEIAKGLITEKYSKMRQDALEKESQKAADLYQKELKSAASSAAGAMNALGELVGAFAEESKEAEAAQKAFAFGSLLINQAMAVAAGARGIAEAMAGAAAAAAATGPAAPIMLGVYQAQMVGQVLALVASVASTIVQAKQIFSEADAGKYANGGIVPGTSYSGDRLTAHVNSREMILPMDEQRALFDILSTSADGQRTLGIDYGMMAQAMASVPAPQLVLTELAQEQAKIVTIKEQAKI